VLIVIRRKKKFTIFFGKESSSPFSEESPLEPALTYITVFGIFKRNTPTNYTGQA